MQRSDNKQITEDSSRLKDVENALTPEDVVNRETGDDFKCLFQVRNCAV